MESSPAPRPRAVRGAWPALGSIVLVCAFLSAAPEVVEAEIYRWTDASGRLHFSQDLSQVPPEQRARAEAAAKKPRERDPLQIYAPRGSDEDRDEPHATAAVHVRSDRAMRIPFERHGTLMKVDVLLNGRVRAPFYVDTGASGVSIPWSVAKQLGLYVGPDSPHIEVRTANGLISEPLVSLRSVQLGPARVDDVTAAVSTTMDIGLLGGAFFNNFVYQVDAAEGVITLVPNRSVRGGHGREAWRARFEEIREPLARLDAYLEKGGFLDEGRVRELEAHRAELQARLDALESEANQAGVPRSWRE